jgi:site-specific recombinase XerC
MDARARRVPMGRRTLGWMEKRLRQKGRTGPRDLSENILFLSKIGELLFKKTPRDSYLFWETSTASLARLKAFEIFISNHSFIHSFIGVCYDVRRTAERDVRTYVRTYDGRRRRRNDDDDDR